MCPKFRQFCCSNLIDIDECSEERDRCDQGCANTLGSYTCTCNSGYHLNSNGYTCNGMDVMIYILVIQFSFPIAVQISMNVLKTEMDVLTPALIQLVHTHVPVVLDISWVVMEEPAKVLSAQWLQPVLDLQCTF